MVINIDNEYYIESDNLNYILTRASLSCGRGSNKTDKPRMVTSVIGYYPTVEKCLEAFLHRTIHERTADFNGTIEDYIQRITDITNKAINEMKRGST